MPAFEVLIAEAVVPDSCPDRPIIIYGGGETGTETAEYLAEAGHHILLVTRSDKQFLARNAEALYRGALLQRLHANPSVRIMDHSRLHAIDGEHVKLIHGDQMIEQPASAVLLAHGLVPDTGLAEALSDVDIPMLSIGDAVQVARIGEAVRDAYRAVHDLQRLTIQPEPIAC